MKIAILGWGSLIWDPERLEFDGTWRPDGPKLPIEFASVSQNGRLTLVLLNEDARGSDPAYEGTDWLSQALWTISNRNDLEAARANLTARETRGNSNDIDRWAHYVTRNGESNAQPEIKDIIQEWLDSHEELDAVIWTGAGVRGEVFEESFTLEKALSYVGGKLDNTALLEYIKNTPLQVDTPLRKRLRSDFQGWFNGGSPEATS